MLRVGLVVGVFDLFHVGHLKLLKSAKEYVDELVVVVNGDKMTEAYKRRPIIREGDRLAIVSSIDCVDDAIISNVFDIKDHLIRYKVTHIIHGNDWPHQSYMKQIQVTEEYLEKGGVSMLYLPYTSGVSTSDIIQSCIQAV